MAVDAGSVKRCSHRGVLSVGSLPDLQGYASVLGVVVDDPGEVSCLLGQVAVRGDDRVTGLQPGTLGGGAGMDTGHLDVTASCIAHLPLIDAKAGKEKGRGPYGSRGLERRGTVGRRIGVAGTRLRHVPGIAVRVRHNRFRRCSQDRSNPNRNRSRDTNRSHNRDRSPVHNPDSRSPAHSPDSRSRSHSPDSRIAITETVPQSAEAEETRVETAVTVPSTPIEPTTHAAATTPAETASAESTSTHVTTTAHATAAVAASASATTTAVRHRQGF